MSWISCTGDACTGDVIMFSETVWEGSFRKPKSKGTRTIKARIVKDSYGVDKQQHTFTLDVEECTGVDLLETGSTIKRKGRNIYRNGTVRLKWADENERRKVLEDKHQRGDEARLARTARKAFQVELD